MAEQKTQKMKALEEGFSKASDIAHKCAFKIRDNYHHYMSLDQLRREGDKLVALSEKMQILGEEYFNTQLNSGINPKPYPNYEKFFVYLPRVLDALDRESALRGKDDENDFLAEQDFFED